MARPAQFSFDRQILTTVSHRTTVDQGAVAADVFPCAKLVGMLFVLRLALTNPAFAEKVERMGR